MRDLLALSMPAVWVTGEVQRLRRSRGGHLYFELIEKGSGDDIVGKLEAVVWRRELAAIERLLAESGQELSEGTEIRGLGKIDFYPPFGRLQLVLRQIDPVFGLGLLERRRRQTLAALDAAGLLDRNARLELPLVPLRVGLVTSKASAAYHDFLGSLEASGYGFVVSFVHAAVQGRGAERDLVTALGLLAGVELDCLVLVRGGGSRTDLAVFDGRRLAETVARAPYPVITGLGHEIDRSIADHVAHTATRTPTQAAELLVSRVAAAERRLAERGRDLRQLAAAPVAAARLRMERAGAAARLTAARLGVGGERLRGLEVRLGRVASGRLRRERRQLLARGVRLAGASGRLLGAAGRRRGELGGRLRAAGTGQLRQAATALDGWSRVTRQLDPVRTLARGFSVTRNADGVVLRSVAAARAAGILETELATGRVLSRVEPR